MAESPNKEILTQEECDIIAQKSLQVKCINRHLKSLAGHVEGYLSSHYILELGYKDNNRKQTAKYFVKYKLDQPGFLSEMANYMEVFNVESCFYEILLAEFEKLEHFSPFTPKYYYANKKVLVLEDLCEQGFHVNERMKPFDMQQCKMVLKSLSLLHSCGLIYEEIKSKEMGIKYRLDLQYPEQFNDRFYSPSKDTPSMRFFLASIQSLVDITDEVPDEIIPDKKSFKEVVRESENIQYDSNIKERYRCTCLHGDLWANNIMFKLDKDVREIVDCRLLDFQFIRYYMPSFDIQLFLFGNTTKKFREENLESLFDFYYKCLKDELKKYTMDLEVILPFDQFKESSIYTALQAKIQAFSDRCLLNLPEEVMIEAENNPDMYSTVLIDSRSKYLIDEYRKNEEFKQYVHEELVELYTISKEKKKLQEMLS